MPPSPDAILDLVETGERVVMRVAWSEGPVEYDVVWEAHLQSCLAGTIVAVARPLGVQRPFEQERFELETVAELAPWPEPGEASEEPANELSKMAAEMAAQAREYEGLSLAERLVRDHIRRERHGSSNEG
jgi:hypothetical protein